MIKKLFNLIPSLASTKRYSLSFLNLSQSLGVINDNVFKFSMAFLLIDALGKQNATAILAATGAIYVIPFLLFSSSAGILADRFSKQKLLVCIKILETVLMACAIVAFATKTVAGCYLILFVLSIHSALFSPSKYGIIAELVPKESVSKANGLITSCTYLSIILGTFLASFLTEVTSHNFILIAIFCLALAVIGLVAALAIYPTTPQGSKTTVNLLVIREIFKTLKSTTSTPHLLPSILGSSYFLMIGAFTQLNIIPFAITALQLNEVAGGYLFLTSALGIACGSFLAGKLSKNRAELGLSCLSGIGITLFFFTLSLFSSSLVIVIFSLFFMGLCGGCFIIPFDTFTQLFSQNNKRGQTIAAANFLSFLGVLIASCLLYVLNNICSFTPAASFGIISLMTLIVTLFFNSILSDLSIPYLCKLLIPRFTSFIPPPPDRIHSLKDPILILENATWAHALKVATCCPSIHFLVPKSSPLWNSLLRFIRAIEGIDHDPLSAALAAKREGTILCLLLDTPYTHTKQSASFTSLFKKSTPPLYHVRLTDTTLSFTPH